MFSEISKITSLLTTQNSARKTLYQIHMRDILEHNHSKINKKERKNVHQCLLSRRFCFLAIICGNSVMSLYYTKYSEKKLVQFEVVSVLWVTHLFNAQEERKIETKICKTKKDFVYSRWFFF